MGCSKADEMNHSVKSKTIRHDCHLLVRAEHRHLQTLVFLLQLFKSSRHELGSIQGDELPPLPLPPSGLKTSSFLSSSHRGVLPGGAGDICPPLTALTTHLGMGLTPALALQPLPTWRNREFIWSLNKLNKEKR